MELLQLLPLLSFLTVIIILLASCLVLKRKGRTSSSWSTSLLQNPSLEPQLPSPSRLPVIGSMHHLVGSVPHRRLCELSRRHGPLMLVRLGQVDFLVVSSPEAAEEVLKIHGTNFACRPKVGSMEFISYGYSDPFFCPYGRYYVQLRKICMLELLNPTRVKSFSSLREEEVHNLVKGIVTTSEGAVPINLSRRLLSLSNNIVFRAVMGKKCRNQERFFVAMREVMNLVSGLVVGDLFPFLSFLDVVTGAKSKLKRLHEFLDRFFDEILREHESEDDREEDLVDVLLRHRESCELDVPLTTNNVKAVILVMFMAGTDTSFTTLEWAMSELMRNPETMEKVQNEVRQSLGRRTKLEESDVRELKFLKLVIKETLRLHPPAPLLPRECREACRVQGYAIPTGTRVLVNAWALARDPRHWDDPDCFRPERFDANPVDFKGLDFNLLPFGAGRRMCSGMTFGLASVDLALAHLLCYFDWELPNGMKADELDMTELYASTVSRKSELYLVARPCVPLSEKLFSMTDSPRGSDV
ncbi:premnaspirodiene oxygenase-like [Iris pallida]|uniref:Premnaspirodiene oxygenase-like n=1 Tax=Iris pallida TaxID=29817 RepID=A0AAX6F0N4_IRIPA|nr:premnaspirodiene oxygenase-like [Iris pallida]